MSEPVPATPELEVQIEQVPHGKVQVRFSDRQLKNYGNGKGVRVLYGNYAFTDKLHPTEGIVLDAKMAKKVARAYKNQKGFTLHRHRVLMEGSGLWDTITGLVGKVIPHVGDIINTGKQAYDIYKKVSGGHVGRGVSTKRTKGGFPFLAALGALPSIISAGKSLFGLGVDGKIAMRGAAGRRAPNLKRDARGRFLPRAGHV